MKTIISRVMTLLLMALPLAGSAQRTTFIGFCEGEVASSSTIGDNNGAEFIEAAALFPASLLSSYDDLEVMGINAGLSSRLNISAMKVWVRESLEGENIFEASLSKEDGIKKGWNKVMGELTPLPVEKDLYVGYTLSLTGASFPVSAVGKSREGGLFLRKGEEWKDMSGDGLGVLSVELVATASNLSPYDLALRQVTFPETVKIGASAPLGLKIYNAGAEDVKRFKVECSVEGYSPVVYDIQEDVASNSGCELTLDFTSPVDVKMPSVEMKVTLKDIEGGEDANPADNTLYVEYSVNRFEFSKKLMMEEFSTEKCTYCPRAAASLHDLLAEPEFEGRILAAAHHAGFGTDWLTLPESTSYLWFYDGGAGNTYAPAFMYDRTSFDGSSPVNNGTDEYASIKSKVAERLAVLPMTALEATADFDPATSHLNVTVEGERLSGYEGGNITVFVVENNIEARRQAGVNETFIHQHVLRAINEIWGDEIEWDDENAFSYSTSLYINPSWAKDNIEVYAFISKYNPQNFKDCTIDNATAAEISWNMAGVESVGFDDESAEAEYYTLSGMRTTRPAEGIYIVKRGDRVTKEYIR